jgi:hypothetical protein
MLLAEDLHRLCKLLYRVLIPLKGGKYYYFNPEKLRTYSREGMERLISQRRPSSSGEKLVLNALLEGIMPRANYGHYRVHNFEAAAVVALSMILHTVNNWPK